MKITKSRLKQIIKEELENISTSEESEDPDEGSVSAEGEAPPSAEDMYNLYRPAADIGYDIREDADDKLKQWLDAAGIWEIEEELEHEQWAAAQGGPDYRGGTWRGRKLPPDSHDEIMAAVRKTSENELQASRSYEADIAELRAQAEASGEDTYWPAGANERRAQFDKDMQEADKPIQALKGYYFVKGIYQAWERVDNQRRRDEEW